MVTGIENRAYGKMAEVEGSFDDVVAATTDALKEQGFGVLTTIEVDRVLDEKIDAKIDRYVILGACNPGLAEQGLRAYIDLGLLLPCNVVVREQDDRRLVTFVDPHAMLTAAGPSAELEALAKDASTRLDAAIAVLVAT